jgi:hypothetical protein
MTGDALPTRFATIDARPRSHSGRMVGHDSGLAPQHCCFAQAGLPDVLVQLAGGVLLWDLSDEEQKRRLGCGARIGTVVPDGPGRQGLRGVLDGAAIDGAGGCGGPAAVASVNAGGSRRAGLITRGCSTRLTRHEPSPVVVVKRHGGSEPDRGDEQSDEHWLDREELDVHGLSFVWVRLTIEPASATRGGQVRRHGRVEVFAEATQVPPRSPPLRLAVSCPVPTVNRSLRERISRRRGTPRGMTRSLFTSWCFRTTSSGPARRSYCCMPGFATGGCGTRRWRRWPLPASTR